MKKILTASVLMAAVMTLVIPIQFTPKVKAFGNYCNPLQDLFCDNFIGNTWYKDQIPFARWNRYSDGDNYATDYIDLGTKLRLQINTNATTTDYVNANISTNVINAVNPYLKFGVNTRVEVLMRFSPNHGMTPMDLGTARGSGGFLFWNYFQQPSNPELGSLATPQDVFGWTWQDAGSTLPGLKIVGVAQGIPGFIQPIFDLDVTQWNKYTIERRHESMKFFVNDALIAEIPLNQAGTLQLPDEHGLALDVWHDNASYVYDLAKFEAHLTYNQQVENTWIEVDYAKGETL